MVAILGVCACDDASTSDPPKLPDLARSIADAASDGATSDADVGDMARRPDAVPPDGALQDAGPVDAAPLCPAGATRCPIEGANAIEYCFAEGWQADTCPDNGQCHGGRCVPDPATCDVGDVVCLGETTRAQCDPERAEWTPIEVCEAGTVCTPDGCTSPACALAARTRSYLGCAFYAVELPNGGERSEATPPYTLGVVVANADQDTAAFVTVRRPDGAIANLYAEQVVPLPEGFPAIGRYRPRTIRSAVRDRDGEIVEAGIARGERIEVPPGGLVTLLLPGLRDDILMGTHVEPLAYQIESTQPVAAYQFNPYCCNFSFSNDASLLLPIQALDRVYHFVGAPGWRDRTVDRTEDYPAGIAIVGVETQTDVVVTLPGERLVAGWDGAVLEGDTLRATIGPRDVFLVQSKQAPGAGAPDLTGALIEATARVAVFSTHQGTYYPASLGASDHLEEQISPVSTWGESFMLVPPPRRAQGLDEAVYWKIAAARPGTRVTLSRVFGALGALRPGFPGVPWCGDLIDGDAIVFDAVTHCEFGTLTPVGLVADGPLMVMGIISGQDSTGIEIPFGQAAGDPALFQMPPDRQYRSSYTFLAPDTYQADYLTIVADPDTQIVLDGEPVDLSGAVPVPQTGRVYLTQRIRRGQHHIEGDDPFGIIVFAFDDFVSYAYTGGMNLQKR
jgi:hypothetical protein